MFKISCRQTEWYEDGIEVTSGLSDQCWRLDLDDEIQIQLFAYPVHFNADLDRFVGEGNERDAEHEYRAARLFIERDVREATEEEKRRAVNRRVHYACEDFKISDETALLLFKSKPEEVAKMLKREIITVRRLPSRPEFCHEAAV